MCLLGDSAACLNLRTTGKNLQSERIMFKLEENKILLSANHPHQNAELESVNVDQVEKKEENETFFANLGDMQVSEAKRQKLNTLSG